MVLCRECDVCEGQAFLCYHVKVKLPLCLTKYHTMKTYWGSGGIAPYIHNLSTYKGAWSASCPSHFNSGVRAPDAH
jgi:hypothetical protein